MHFFVDSVGCVDILMAECDLKEIASTTLVSADSMRQGKQFQHDIRALHLLTTKKLIRRVFEQENARLTNMGDLEDVPDGLIGCPDLIVPQCNTYGVHGGRTRSLMSFK